MQGKRGEASGGVFFLQDLMEGALWNLRLCWVVCVFMGRVVLNVGGSFSSHLGATHVVENLSVSSLIHQVGNIIDGRSVSGCRHKLVGPGDRILLTVDGYLGLPVSCFCQSSVTVSGVSFERSTEVPTHSSRHLMTLTRSGIRHCLVLRSLLSVSSSFGGPLDHVEVRSCGSIRGTTRLLHGR